MTGVLTILSLLFGLPLQATAGPFGVKSGITQNNLVELYSSEGCSSCPPAEKWMAGLRSRKSLWKTFVPLGFHVDYWNRLGWVDRFSQEEYTRRQYRYSSEWRSSRVYTPGFVLNGREWRMKRKGAALEKKGKPVGVLSATKTGKHKYRVTFRPNGKPGLMVLYGALLGNGLVSHVLRGENKGRTLKHEFVVLALDKQGMKEKGKTLTAEVTLKPKGKIAPKSNSVAFWVTTWKSQAPVQAVGGDL